MIDVVSVPKDGRMSVGVAPQYCGALGERADCQVAVSVHAAADTASCPLQWRVFLPEEWASDTGRRTTTRIPPGVTHREKWRLALDMLDTLVSWGMTPPVVVADAACGTNAHLRTALSDRGLAHVLAVRADVTAQPFDAEPVAPARNGPVGCWPQPRYRWPAPSVAVLAAGLEHGAFTGVTWRNIVRGECLRAARRAALRRPRRSPGRGAGRCRGPGHRRRRLYEQTRRDAERFQQLLRPRLPHRLEPFDAATAYRPATTAGHVGGDWFDVQLVPDQTCAAVIGGVLGHDLKAAAAMAQTRNMLRAILYTRRIPLSAALAELDRTLDALTDNPITTVCLARTEPGQPAGWTLRWSTAVHLPPLLATPGRQARYLHAPPTCPSVSTPPPPVMTTPTPCPPGPQ